MSSKGDSFLKALWSKLDPKTKKKVTVMSIILGIVLLALGGYYVSHSNNKQQTTTEKQKMVDITLQPGILEKNINNNVNLKLEQFDKKLSKLQKELKKAQTANRQPSLFATNNKQQTTQQTPNSQQTPQQTNKRFPVPPPPPAPQGIGTPVNGGLASGGGTNGNKHAIQGKPEIIGAIGVSSNPNASSEEEKAKASLKKKKATNSVYLPPSFMQATLLSGLDAPTMNGAQSNPVPVLLLVRAPAILPNRVRANLKGCFIIAEGVGNLASERVMLRLVSLSCIAKNGKAVIDQPVKGFVVGSDGKIGLRGRVVSKMGAVLARAALAGFLTGFGNAIQTSAATTYSSTLGTTSTINSADIAKASIGGGLSAATKKLSDFYMKLADQTLPVIEIGATRRVTVVVSKGVSLKIKNVCIGGQKCEK